MLKPYYRTGRINILSLLLLLCCLKGVSQKNAAPMQLFNGKVVMQLPVAFKPDSTLVDATYRFATSTPAYIFSSPPDQVKCLVFKEPDSLSDNDVPAFADVLIAKVKNLYPSVKITDDGISLNAGKNIGYIRCMENSGNAKKFFQFFYGSFRGRLLLFLVMCNDKNSKKWIPSVDFMITSLRINDYQ